jgi:hypothetical protein
MTRWLGALSIVAAIVVAPSADAGDGPLQPQPYIGKVIHFYGFQDPVGCRNPRMALKVSRLKNWERRNFADDLRFRGERDTSCTLLRDANDAEWRIADIEQYRGRPDWLWLCVESTIDFRSTEEIRRNPPRPDPTNCFWTLVSNRSL